jgi:pimeloyl-ACP methyl ester carboxylesterase
MTTPTLALHTLRDGFGLPVLLLHAFPVDHRIWVDLAAALPGAPTVLALDIPGLGDSLPPAAGPSIDVVADAIAAALGGHTRVVVVGASMGGYLALALAARHPRLVAGLGLVDTKSTADSDEQRANRLRIAHEVEQSQTVGPVLGMAGVLIGATSRRERPELTARIEGWIRGQRPAGVAWALRAMAARKDLTAVLETFDGPVWVAVGEEDELTPLAEAEHMASAARNARLESIPGTGHLSIVEAPQAVAAGVSALMDRATSMNRATD